MKKLFLLFFTILSVFVFTGCSDERGEWEKTRTKLKVGNKLDFTPKENVYIELHKAGTENTAYIVFYSSLGLNSERYYVGISNKDSIINSIWVK